MVEDHPRPGMTNLCDMLDIEALGVLSSKIGGSHPGHPHAQFRTPLPAPVARESTRESSGCEVRDLGTLNPPILLLAGHQDVLHTGIMSFAKNDGRR